MELGIVLFQDDLAFLVREPAAAEPFLHLDRPQARLGEVHAHDGPEASLVKLPEEQGRGRGSHAVERAQFPELLLRKKLVRKGQADSPHGCGCLGRVDGPLFRFLDHDVRAQVLERQAHRLLIGGRDRVDGDEEGDADRDTEDIDKGPVMVMTQFLYVCSDSSWHPHFFAVAWSRAAFKSSTVHFPWKKAGPEPVGKPTNCTFLTPTVTTGESSIQMTRGTCCFIPFLAMNCSPSWLSKSYQETVSLSPYLEKTPLILFEGFFQGTVVHVEHLDLGRLGSRMSAETKAEGKRERTNKEQLSS